MEFEHVFSDWQDVNGLTNSVHWLIIPRKTVAFIAGNTD